MLVRMTGRNMKSNKFDYTQGGESALIHLNINKEQKGRWIQASRAEGKKLSEWIIDIVEQMSNSSRNVPAFARVSQSEMDAIIDEVKKEHNWRRRRDGKRLRYPLFGVLINTTVFTSLHNDDGTPWTATGNDDWEQALITVTENSVLIEWNMIGSCDSMNFEYVRKSSSTPQQ